MLPCLLILTVESRKLVYFGLPENFVDAVLNLALHREANAGASLVVRLFLVQFIERTFFRCSKLQQNGDGYK
jgi:hypothetical protein